MSVNPETFKAVMGQWPSGVTVITTEDAEGFGGMTASSFSSVSLNPPLISICVARYLRMHDRIRQAGRFAVNILSKDSQEHGMRFAGMLPGVEDRFAGVTTRTASTGCPVLTDTLGWIDCRLWASYDGGDHSIFVGEVLAAGIDDTAVPLLYHSRSWGQFADVLAEQATVLDAADDGDALVIPDAFGQPQAPAPVGTLVARVREALDSTPAPSLLLLDDRPSAADPVQLRQALQAIAGVVGRTPVGLRPGAGPMALANVLVALKSGVHHLSAASDTDHYVAMPDLVDMLQRMQVGILPAAALA